MTAAPRSAQQRAIELATRLAARGARSPLASPEASEAVEREPGGDERRLAVLTEAYRLAIREGALKLGPDQVARASASVPCVGSLHEPPVEAEAIRSSAAWEMLKPAEPPLGAPDAGGCEPAGRAGPEEHEAEGEPGERAHVVSPGWRLERPSRRVAAETLEPEQDDTILQDSSGRPGLGCGPGPRLSPPGAAPGFRPRAQHFALAALIAGAALAVPLLWGPGDEEQGAGPSATASSAGLPADDDDPPPLSLPPAPDMADLVLAPAPEEAAETPRTPEQLAAEPQAEPQAPVVPVAPPAAPVASAAPPPAVAPPRPAAPVIPVAPPPPATVAIVAPPLAAPSAPQASPPPPRAEPPRAPVASSAPPAPAGALSGGLPVALPPRVVVEYAPGGQERRAKADQVAGQLRDKGVVVVAISAGESRRPMSVDYAFTQDRSGAEQVASVLGRPWQARALPAGSNDRPPEPGTVRLMLP